MPRVGFIGLGTMGGQMARHLQAAEGDLVVFDVDEAAMAPLVAAGAESADSAAHLAELADVVMLSLPGPDEVLAVVDAVQDGLEAGDVLVDLTTSTPSTTEQVSDRLSDVVVLSAPVSGGPSGAAEGTLSVMVSGDPDVYDECRQYFDVIGSNVFYVDEQPGHGHAMKLVNNYLSFVAMICTSEAIVLGEQVGLEAQTMIDVFNESSARNTASSFKFPEYILTGTYDMGYEMDLVEKDMQLLMDVSHETETPFMAGGTIRQLIAYVRGELGEEADYTEIYKYFDSVMGDAQRR